jgi:hypothetical protein
MQPDGRGRLEPIASFITNPAGAAIVNSLGPIRQVVVRFLLLKLDAISSSHPGQASKLERQYKCKCLEANCVSFRNGRSRND